MLFKKKLLQTKIILVSYLFLILSACNLPIGEAPPQQIAPKPDLGFESKCLSNVLPTMAEFIKGTASSNQIASSWNCFISGLTVFSRKVKGEGPEEYSARELAQFFEDFLFENLKLNQTLLIEIMRIKQVLVGGKIDTLTRSEIDGLIQFANLARDASIEILPHMKIISLNWNLQQEIAPYLKLAEFRKANMAFHHFIQMIGNQIQKNNVEYRLSSLLSLLSEISTLYGDQWSFLSSLQKYLPIIEDLKKALIGGEGSLVGPTEWLRFATLISRGYMQYARYHYFLRGISSNMSSFELLFLADALDDLLSFLSNLTQFKPGGKLSIPDIILATNSLKIIFNNLHISPSMIQQIFYLKQLFFGGSSDIALPEEFERGREKIRLFERIAQQFFSHAEIYFFRANNQHPLPDQDKEKLNLAMGDLLTLSRDMIPIFETGYDLTHFKTLIEETSTLMLGINDQPSQTLIQVLRFFPVMQALKNLATATKSSFISKSDWPLITRFAALTFNHFLYFHYNLSSAPTWRTEMVPAGQFLEAIINHLQEIVTIHRGSIGFPYCYEIIDSLYHAKYISQRWPASAIKRIFFVTIQKVLRARSLPRNAQATGILTEHLENVREIADHFKSTHQTLTALFVSKNKDEISRSELVTDLLQFPENLRKLLNTIFIQPSFNLASTNTGRLVFDKSKKTIYDLVSVQNKNIFRVLSEVLLRAYSQDASLHLSKEEYDRFITDILPILMELKLTSPDKPDFGNSRFLEANLFMPSSNGDRVLDYAEAVELLQFLWSGILRHNQILHSISQNCSAKMLLFPEFEYSIDCWLEQSYQSLSSAYVEMTDALRFFGSLNRPQFFKIWNSFLTATSYVPARPGLVSTKDLSLVPHLVQYAESLINRFDMNFDEILDRQEALKAFPTFQQMLQAATGFKNRRILRAGYAYLLVYKKLPKTLKERLHFLVIWTGQEEEWPISVDRSDLSKILEEIAILLQKDKGHTAAPNTHLSEINDFEMIDLE